MAHEFYVTIEATKQGKLAGESKRDEHAGKLTGRAFSYEIKSPRDVATGQASGKRQHGTVTFTKVWGAASPQIFQAAVTNETLKSVLFEFVRTNDAGEEYVFATTKLTNASIASIHRYSDIDPAEVPELEDVALSFQSIEISDLDGKTVATDSVGGRP